MKFSQKENFKILSSAPLSAVLTAVLKQVANNQDNEVVNTNKQTTN